MAINDGFYVYAAPNHDDYRDPIGPSPRYIAPVVRPCIEAPGQIQWFPVGSEADLAELLDAVDAFGPPATEAGMRLAVVVAKLRERQRARKAGK